jgi:L-alanine-DL-glutamate epimerase-like enolase superfamily enzyme
MKSIIKQIAESDKKKERAEAKANEAEISDPGTANSRREFLKKAAIGGIALGGSMNLSSIEETIEQTTSKVQRSSAPSELKITDLRLISVNRCGIIRVDTNQGIYGLGEVRDGADPRYALPLKSRILGLNPCDVEMVFKTIRQFGFHGRQGGGVCAVEMAMWDLCGKAYGVPAWQLLGGKYRTRVRMYCDTPTVADPAEFAAKLKHRIEVQGYSWLKMDLGTGVVAKMPNTLVNNKFWAEMPRDQYSSLIGTQNTLHPFTQIQITDKGLEEMAKYIETIRNTVGYEIPLGVDHFGHFDKNTAIRLGKAFEKFSLAYLEDLVPWFYTDMWKTISDALETPTLTGEDIYCLRNGFKPLIDAQAVDIIQPDLVTSGGLLETKKIGDYAEENGIAMILHNAGTPVGFMANVHCAAATQNFLALEHHSVDVPYWENLVKVTGSQPMITKGYANVPLDSPGLGIELNDEEVKKHLSPSVKGYFEPTPEWDQRIGNDRLWS